MFAKRIRLFLAGFFSLIFIQLVSLPAQALSDRVYKDLSTFSKVLDIVDKYYVTPVNEKDLITGAINGMLSTTDPHTIYLPADIYKEFASDTRGQFGGLGIEVTVKDGILTVVAPLQDTPAWTAGIKSGDKIMLIDGKSTKNMMLGEALHLMRGSIGKKISITIWRAGKPITVTLTRELIKVPGVKVTDLGEGYGLFHITTFQEGVAKQLKKSIETFEEAHGKLNGIILDLRDDPGGLLNEAVKVSDYFLDKGVIVSTKGRSQEAEVYKAHEVGTFRDVPLVLLINGGSASASEIVAGALKENNRAKLMGTRSFGKGSVQTVINLDNGDAVKITIAHYFTPKDRLIDGKGIDPDILLDKKAFRKKNKLKKDAAESSGDNEADNEKTFTRDDFNEYQVQEALSYLKKMVRL